MKFHLNGKQWIRVPYSVRICNACGLLLLTVSDIWLALPKCVLEL
jgi:hypothetical protein